MNVQELINELEKLEDKTQPVMFQDHNSHAGICAVNELSERVSSGQYPEDWIVPEEFRFVLLKN